MKNILKKIDNSTLDLIDAICWVIVMFSFFWFDINHLFMKAIRFIALILIIICAILKIKKGKTKNNE